MDYTKRYSLMKNEDKHFEVYDSENEKSFKVAKRDVHPATQMKIMGLPKYADGGEVRPGLALEIDGLKDRYPEQSEIYQAPLLAQNDAPPQQGMPAPYPPQVPEAVLQNPPVTQTQQQPQAAAPQMPSMDPTGIGQQYEKAAMGAARAEGQQQQQIAKAYDPFLKAQEEQSRVFQEKMTNYQAQADQLAQDVAASKIEPKNYYGSLDSSSRVSTAIGVLLGGIGQGLMGSQSNAAMDYINKQIDRDIEAQKVNLGKKQSLLSSNFQIQGNLMAAEASTRAQMAAIVQGQIAKIAAQSNSPILMEKARMAALEFKGKMEAPFIEQAAKHQAQQQMAKAAMASGTPEGVLAAMAQTPEEFQNASKELIALKNHAKQKDAITNAFDRMDKENTVTGRAGRMGYEPPSIAGFQSLVMPYLKDAEGRINEMELERTDKLIPKPGDAPQTVQSKRKDLLRFLDEKTPSTAYMIKFGINPRALEKKKFSEGPVR